MSLVNKIKSVGKKVSLTAGGLVMALVLAKSADANVIEARLYADGKSPNNSVSCHTLEQDSFWDPYVTVGFDGPGLDQTDLPLILMDFYLVQMLMAILFIGIGDQQ